MIGFGTGIWPLAVGQNGGALPSPIAIFGSDLVAWWDFADAATVTQSGGFLDSITDKSGNGRTLVGATTKRPAYSATGFHNAVGAAVFDGVDDILTTASFNPNFGTLCSTFIHCEWHTGTVVGNGTPTANKRLVSYKKDTDAFDFSSAASGVLMVLTGNGFELEGYRAAHLSHSNTIPDYGSSPMMAKQHARMCTVFDGVNQTTYIENIAATPVACTAAFGGPGTISLGGDVGATDPWAGAVTELVITRGVPTAAQRKQMQQWHVRRWPKVVVCCGDSLVHAGPTDANNHGFIYKAIENIGSTHYIVNKAIGGTSFSGAPSDYLNTVQAIAHDQVPSRKYGQKYILYVAYSNNIGLAPAYTDLFGVAAAAARAAGYDAVVTSTLLSRSDGQANDPRRDADNAVFAGAGWAAAHGFAAIADFAADPIMGIDGATTINAAYFADNVHPNATGNARLEPIWRAAIQAAV